MPVIPEFLGGPNGWLGYTAVVILLIAFFWKPVRVIYSRLKEFAAFLDQWNGKAEKKDRSGQIVQHAEPGVSARILTLEEKTERIHHEVTPNHGGSIKDAVKRIEERGNETAYKLAETTEKLDEHIVIAKDSDKAQERLIADIGKLKSKYAPEK
ncbi:hypothetical protein ACIOTN_17215 [Glutamicibacter sp. NPDC087661]|uniref:hypothetical protein n=1 Tax=Glutamicibacter sp. NPDC087661 TaxID=3363996 RepID=UPI00383088AA